MENSSNTNESKIGKTLHNPAEVTEDKLSLVDRAIIFAVKAHNGSYRKSSKTPYIVHPMEAGVIAASLSVGLSPEERETIIAAALLHDVLEDTVTTPEDVRRLFGDEVLRLIKSDSENKRPDLPSAETWEIRKQETLDFVRNEARFDEKIVIFADKLSNIRSVCQDYRRIGDELWNRFNIKDKKKHGWYYCSFIDLMKEFEGQTAYDEYKEKCAEIFGE